MTNFYTLLSVKRRVKVSINSIVFIHETCHKTFFDDLRDVCIPEAQFLSIMTFSLRLSSHKDIH